MVTKYFNAIILNAFIILSIFQGERKSKSAEDLKMILASETDTCYYSGDKLGIIIIMKNTGSSKIKIDKKIPVSTYGGPGEIDLKIYHNESFYISTQLDGKDGMPKLRNVTKNRALVIEDNINFKQLMINIPGQYSNIWKRKDNLDFGVYKLQAIYISSSNDTIKSNWISVNYLKNN